MKKFLSFLLSGAMAWIASTAMAQEPTITMRTGIYDTAGPNNACTIVVGGTQDKYIEVDCGFGPVEYQLKEYSFDSTSQSLNGTAISCQVSSEGIIKIYADDDAVIDFLDAEGCTLEWIKFADPSTIEVLNLNHNSLCELDLSDFSNLRIAYLTDNPYDKSPLIIGKDHPELLMLEIDIVPNIDPEFDITTYPQLRILDAFAVPGITKIDPTNCPHLVRLSIDCTNVSSLDLRNNAALQILNISETAISEIDLSPCPKLQQFFCTHGSDTYNPDTKLKSLDISMLPELYYLFATGNELKSIDVSKNTKLDHLWLGSNQLTELNIDNCPNIVSLHIENNYFNYATLPGERETFIEYDYGQKPLAVPLQLEVGKPLDLSAQVIRPGTETYARLMSFKRQTPYAPTEVDASKYDYENGVLTVKSAIADSVYIEFANTEFTYPPLVTSNFMVKRASDKDKPNLQMIFQPSGQQGQQIQLSVGIEGASVDNPRNLYVVQSDGSTTTIPLTTSKMPDTPNVSFEFIGWGNTSLYVDEGDRVSAVGIDGLTMYSCNVTPMSSLRSLSVTNAGLYEIDLTYNRCLEELNLSGNALTSIDLDGASGSYSKTKLSYIDLSDNKLSKFSISDRRGIHYLDLHKNNFEEIDLTDADNIEYLDLSHNKLTALKVNYQINMTELNASYNNISSYVAPESDALKKADFSHNAFTFSTLPTRGNIAEFIYAPQAQIQIAPKAPGVDLSSENVTIDGEPVVFTWFRADGTKLVEGTDYKITDGRTLFLSTSFGPAYCVLSCAALPDFSGENALRTTDVTPTEMPTNVIASFTTAAAGTMHLSLAAHNVGSSIYIDWNGDGTDIVQYTLKKTYTLFDAKVKAGANVKVLYPEEENDMSVFSIDGVKLSSFDGAKLNKLINLDVGGAGLSEITLPESDQLIELSLYGNNLTEFDPSRYPLLRALSLSTNALTTLDLSGCPDLQVFAAYGNKLTSVKFAENSKLYYIDLGNNLLESFDAQAHPAINTLGLAANKLSELNIDGLGNLVKLVIDNNRFTFATLPLPTDIMRQYTYNNQAPVEAIVDGLTVDLSSQKEVAGTPTVYRWFIGEPYYNNETGEIEGEELVLGEEYTVENGVTTLMQGYENMVCVMTNTELPNVILTTNFLNFTGIESVSTEDVDAQAEYYTLSGVKVNNPSAGIYIMVRGGKASKVMIR